MITPNELRFGNYISYNDKPVQIYELGIKSCNEGAIPYDEAEPIPITAEMTYKSKTKELSQRLYNQKGLWILDYGFETKREIKYVHELQNVFFSILREELIINL